MALENPSYVISSASHSATLFRETAQTQLNGTGVVGSGDLAVLAQGTPNMSVYVTPGMVWIPGTLGATAGMPVNTNAQTAYGLPAGLTAQGSYCAYNDGNTTLTIAAADPTNPRIDLICASVQDAQYAGSNNQPVPQVITGTPAPSPSAPAAPASTVVLAQVAVAAGVTSIVTANITDERPVMVMANRAMRWSYSRGTGSTNYTSGSFVYLLGVTLPASAPAGNYAITTTVAIASTSSAYNQLRVFDPASNNLSGDIQTPNIGAGTTGIMWSRCVPLAAGGGSIIVYSNVSAGTPSVNNAMSFLDVVYLGRS